MTTESENKKLIRKLNKGFEAGDKGAILSCLADDIVWEVPPHFTARGKTEFREQIASPQAEGPPVIEIRHMVEEDGWVTLEGYVENKFVGGGIFRGRFHNAYRIRNGLVVTMTSYVVPVP